MTCQHFLSFKLNLNVGNVGDMTIDMSRLVGQDAAGNISSSVDIISMGMIPNDYGFVNRYIKIGRSRCCW